jgi:monocyte-to-macrophage differentiation protein
LKELFHRGDRAMIYLFIAGSYTPWLCLKDYPEDAWTHSLRSAVWLLAALGIVYQQVFHERYKWLETTFYVFIGLVPALAVLEMVILEFAFLGIRI